MKITHNVIFLFGFVYYLVIPLLIADSNYLDGYPLINKWKMLLDHRYLVEYYKIIGIFFIAFYSGSIFGKILPLKKIKLIQENKYYSFSYLLNIMVVITLVIIIVNRHSFFVGYKNYNDTLLGQLGTINMILTMIYIYKRIYEYQTKVYYSHKLLLGLIGIISILLLGNGSRMAVLFSILAIIYFHINYHFISIPKAFFALFVFLLVFLLIANVRIGGGFEPEMFVYFFFAEPIFTSYSTLTFISNSDNINAFNMPVNFLSSFLNFIPSFIIPNKRDYIYNMHDLAEYHSPLGADSIFVSLLVNFGYLGSFIFLFLLGFLLTIIGRQRKIFFKTYYILLLAILSFQFFRDNFAVLNKVMIYNILIIPLVYFVLIQILQRVLYYENNL